MEATTDEKESMELQNMWLLVLHSSYEFHLHTFSRSFLHLFLKNVVFFAFVSEYRRTLGFETSANDNDGRRPPASQYTGMPQAETVLPVQCIVQ
jgi:hypothetical protein